MTSRERIEATLRFRKPDRVPVDLHNFQPAAAATGAPLSEVFSKGEFLADAMIAAWREFGHDMILVENGTACSAQACGVGVVYREDMAPVASVPAISSLDDVGELRVPDPYTTFPMSEIIKATRIVSREIGDKVWICGRADQGAFALAAEIRGMSNFFLDIAGEADARQVEGLLEFSNSVSIRYAAALLESGAHSVSIGDSVAGPAMLSPVQYRSLASRYQRQFVQAIRKLGGIAHVHICGNVIPIIGEFVATGADILEIDQKTDMTAAKQEAAGRATLLGPVDTGLLASGTPDQVQDAARDAIRILGDRHGFILGPGCAMGPETPNENIHALVEAANRYGR